MKRLMRRFWPDRKGNVAVLFAFAIVPVVGAVSAAVDYSLAAAYRTDMQKALDSTALALSKLIPMEQQQLDTLAMQYFEASMGNHDLSNLKLRVLPDQGKVVLHVSGDYKPKLVSLFGATQFEIGTSSEAIWNMGKVEVALVLDMSLSMQTPDPARIQALRTSTVNLLNVLENAAREPGDAKVAIVPFDGMVNINNASYTSKNAPSWIRWDWWDANAYDSIGNRCKINGASATFTVSNVPAGKWLKKHCEEQSTTTSSCQGGSGSTKSACEKTKGAKWVTTTHYGVWTSLNRNQWAGCVYDRYEKNPSNNNTLNYDVLDTAPTGNTSYYPAAPCYDTPPQAITALSMDWAGLRTKANNFTPTGYTNIPIGLAWGWHLLSPGAPYAEGAAYDTEDLTKFIVLMTDGYNTKNVQMEPGNCNTNGPTCPTVDARMSLVCTNIKNAGIKIYTIRLIAGNADLLRACATSVDMYYDVQSTSQLASAFNAIGAEIASLHLAK